MVGVVEEEDDDADGLVETRQERELAGGIADEGEAAKAEEDELPVDTIDAYWLQRECGKYFSDPLVAQKVSEDS